MKILILLFTLAFAAWAKRSAPAELPKLSRDGVSYSIERVSRRGGYERSVVATKAGRVIWKTQLFEHAFDPKLETDVQVIEVRSWSLKGGHLTVVDERSDTYVLDATTGRLISPEAPQAGLSLTEVTKGSVYDRMGLRAGDRILSINGHTVEPSLDIPALVKAGGQMNIEIVRDRHVEILALDLEPAK